ncbi:carbon-nitrogen hydrolase family protein [Phenylobacterium terrae]|uniref:Carbon-nitrogen hydrolase family protein n=1 Tax=Phenylobacterium terrae TaxID=2665495 RepID=A0ABW4MWI5_9CAUL
MVRIAAAQTPEFIEDVEGALAYAAAAIAQAQARGAALLCFPEGYLQGYLTEERAARRCAFDLSSSAFEAVLDRLPRDGPTVILGLIELEAGRLFNTAAVVRGGTLLGRYRKSHLLGGERTFTPGDDCPAFEAAGVRFGVNICYDTNFPEAARKVADSGAALIVCPANNMMPRAAAEIWKHEHNRARGARCRETGLWLLSADVTGERDGRIAWGPTAVLDPAGAVAAQLPLGEPGLLVFDLPA